MFGDYFQDTVRRWAVVPRATPFYNSMINVRVIFLKGHTNFFVFQAPPK
jgi:hypothetical protein